MSFTEFISYQREGWQRNRPFLDLLDVHVSLLEILDGEQTDKQWNWIDASLLRARVERAVTWLGSLQVDDRVCGLSAVPLIFLQGNLPALDQLALQGPGMHSQDLKGAAPEAYYTIWGTSLTWHLIKPLTWRGWRVPPLQQYAFRADREMCRVVAERHVPTPQSDVTCYQMPNLPELLRVSNRTATEHLARMIIHDMGHRVLPGVSPEHEELHDRLMIWVSGAWEDRQPCANPNERVILAECTDPLFMIRRERRLRPGKSRVLSYINRQLDEWDKRRAPARQRLWGLPAANHQMAVARIMERLLYEQLRGFPGYSPLPST